MRHFTLDEANALVPTLTPILEELRELYHRMSQAAAEVHGFEARAGQNGHGENTRVFSPEYDLRKIHSDLEQRALYLRGIGVHLKDIEHGILDFPTRMFGRDVYLCWRLGEERVSHWHDIDAGFAGRRPL
jgi:hypothetical protein